MARTAATANAPGFEGEAPRRTASDTGLTEGSATSAVARKLASNALLGCPRWGRVACVRADGGRCPLALAKWIARLDVTESLG